MAEQIKKINCLQWIQDKDSPCTFATESSLNCKFCPNCGVEFSKKTNLSRVRCPNYDEDDEKICGKLLEIDVHGKEGAICGTCGEEIPSEVWKQVPEWRTPVDDLAHQRDSLCHQILPSGKLCGYLHETHAERGDACDGCGIVYSSTYPVTSICCPFIKNDKVCKNKLEKKEIPQFCNMCGTFIPSNIWCQGKRYEDINFPEKEPPVQKPKRGVCHQIMESGELCSETRSGDPSDKFCRKCRVKFSTIKKVATVTCPNPLENGTICRNELTSAEMADDPKCQKCRYSIPSELWLQGRCKGKGSKTKLSTPGDGKVPNEESKSGLEQTTVGAEEPTSTTTSDKHAASRENPQMSRSYDQFLGESVTRPGEVLVHFHAVVPDKTVIKDKHEVVIEFTSPTIKGNVLMRPSDRDNYSSEQNEVTYEGEAFIDSHLIKGENEGLQYRYFFGSPDGTYKGRDQYGERANTRKICSKAQLNENEGEIWQFDGPIFVDKSVPLTDRIWEADFEKALLRSLPSWQISGSTSAEKFLSRLEQAIGCSYVWKISWNTSKSRNKILEEYLSKGKKLLCNLPSLQKQITTICLLYLLREHCKSAILNLASLLENLKIQKHVTPEESQYISETFGDQKQKIVDMLIGLMKDLKNDELTFFYVLPFIHILRDDKPSPFTMFREECEFCGFKGMEDIKGALYRRAKVQPREMDKIFNMLKESWLKADELIIRSFASCLDWARLLEYMTQYQEIFTPEMCFALCFHKVSATRNGNMTIEYTILEKVAERILKNDDWFNPSSKTSDCFPNKRHLLTIMLENFPEVFGQISDDTFINNQVSLIHFWMQILVKYVRTAEQAIEDYPTESYLQVVNQCVERCLKSKNGSLMIKGNSTQQCYQAVNMKLKALSELFDLEWVVIHHREEFHEHVKECLRQFYSQITDANLMYMYLRGLPDIKPSLMRTVVLEKGKAILEKMAKEGNPNIQYGEFETITLSEDACIALDQLFEKSYATDSGDDVGLSFILGAMSECFISIANLIGERFLQTRFEKIKSSVDEGIQILSDSFDSMRNRTIALNSAKTMMQRPRIMQIISLLGYSRHWKSLKINVSEADFDCVQDLIKMFSKEKTEVSEFAKFIELDCAWIKTLSEKCAETPLTLGDIQDNHQPSREAILACYFKLNQESIQMKNAFISNNHIHFFHQSWQEHKKSNLGFLDDRASIECQERFYSEIWVPFFSSFKEVCRQLYTGEIQLAKLKSFEPFDNADLERCIEVGGENITERQKRKEEISSYQNSKLQFALLDCIEKLKKTYCIQFDLRQGPSIDETLLLRDACSIPFDDRLKTVGEITETKISALKTFTDCENFVKWLGDNVHSAEQANTLIDFAMMNAEGQGSAEVQKISCINTALRGYGPLIFNMKNIRHFDECLEYIKILWQEIDDETPTKAEKEETSKIGKSLITANTLVDWLQIIKDTQGSTTFDAMVIVEEINKSGMISICNDSQESAIKSKITTLEFSQSSISRDVLTCLKGKKFLSMGQLEEIQGKLMLLGGWEKDHGGYARRFIQILEGVTSIEAKLLSLMAMGNLLFKKCQILVYFSPHATIKTRVKLGSDFVIDTGQLEDVISNISELTTFLDTCSKEWKQFVSRERDRYYFLNYYTSKQIVILQEKLAELRNGKTEKPDQTLKCLLEEISLDIMDKDVKDFLEESSKELDDLLAKEEVTSDLDPNDAETREIRKQFIEDIRKAGYGVWLAVRALKAQGDNISTQEGIMWCMEHEEDEEADTPLVEQFSFDVSDRSTCEDLDDMIFGQRLKEMWKRFKKTFSNNMPDFISLTHLGLFLNKIGSKQVNFDRGWPTFFKRKCPNLLVLDKGDIPQTIMTVYMESKNEEGCLPGPDEVLICNSSSNSEEVELLFRRCIACKTKKIYCLCITDILSYDVANEIDAHFDMLYDSTADYQLFVVCDKLVEVSSPLISSLYKYRVTIDRFVTLDEIRHFLMAQFEVSDGKKQGKELKRILDSRTKKTSAVRLVTSDRACMGKTHRIRRMKDKIKDKARIVTIGLHLTTFDISRVVDMLLIGSANTHWDDTTLYHIDIGQNVLEKVDNFLFSLLILGRLCNKKGEMWRRKTHDIYIIESTLLRRPEASKRHPQYGVLDMLPRLICWSPRESLAHYTAGDGQPMIDKDIDQLIDDAEFQEPTFTLPYRYLSDMHMRQPMRQPSKTGIDAKDQLAMYIKHCEMENPSWGEIRNFVCFLYEQLKTCESSEFFKPTVLQHLPRTFKGFVVRFLLQMSKDFSRRTFEMAEEHDEEQNRLTIERKWESSPHPYILFNPDKTLSFIGFTLQDLNLIHPKSGQVLEENIIESNLKGALELNGVKFNENFDNISREQQLEKLCHVMGFDFYEDPDPTYEMTSDNAKKIMAIHMRFQCGIPVVVMGETGCGKTRLITFMCALQLQGVSGMLRNTKEQAAKQERNMVLVRVHGGTTEDEIKDEYDSAKSLAHNNKTKFGIYTILFFDEANATEAIGFIKEIMCNEGKESPLKLVAACNPYRRHSKEMIQRFELAGLGYHMSGHKIRDRMGKLPMRHLVYRVQPLPQSLHSLVWDFGTLSSEVERVYINKMVETVAKTEGFGDNSKHIAEIIAASQAFMRELKGECSFVSLRNVERVLMVMLWFIGQGEFIFSAMHVADSETTNLSKTDYLAQSLIQALGVCYHGGLDSGSRERYRKLLAEELVRAKFSPAKEPDAILKEIERCQDLFLQEMGLEEHIAKNRALKENVFMMVVCIELKIPLFLIGKPGSSKSLAKSLVESAMQGNGSISRLYRRMKRIQMICCQCSHVSTPESIDEVFHQCKTLQEQDKSGKYAAVVVLDELGLAEDSEKLPLKSLHGLLEPVNVCSGEKNTNNQVAFVGISNWSLDPAKMNRGILLLREMPTDEDLLETARGIFYKEGHDDFLNIISTGYRTLYEKAIQVKKEFYGLRDFYSAIKMVSAMKKPDTCPSWAQLQYAVLRNFGGLENVHELDIFRDEFKKYNLHEETETDKVASPRRLVQDSLKGILKDEISFQSRYLLIMTQSYAGLRIIKEMQKDSITIFGSSFPQDQHFTEICKNINKVKVCMESGKTVILLKLKNLYASLYDTMNQYYVTLGDKRFVDLGLGTQRIKAAVHKNFRLVIIAEKETVYNEFPIPLINRLEKHFLNWETILDESEKKYVNELKEWANQFCLAKKKPSFSKAKEKKLELGDIFIGYNDDLAASITFSMTNADMDSGTRESILTQAKKALLKCCVPDAIVRLSGFTNEEEIFIKDVYYKEQKHECLIDFISQIRKEKDNEIKLLQVTTNSALLTTTNDIAKELMLPQNKVALLHMRSFNTEQQFRAKIKDLLNNSVDLILIQCTLGYMSRVMDLVTCAQHCVQEESTACFEKYGHCSIVAFIIQLPRAIRTLGQTFLNGTWESFHIDELAKCEYNIPPIEELRKMQLSDIFRISQTQKVDQSMTMDVSGLIKNFIQGSASALLECRRENPRGLKRIEKLVELDAKYSHILLSRIHELLLSKEKELGFLAEGWFEKEVAISTAVLNAGTFRRSLLLHLESQVQPLLAAVFAMADTNNNLDALDFDDPLREKMWIEMFQDMSRTPLNYRDVLMSKKEGSTCFPVKTTSVAGKWFTARFPFSWIIIEFFDINYNKVKPDELIDIYRAAYGRIFSTIFSSIGDKEQLVHHKLQLIKDYVHDLLHTHYNSECGEDCPNHEFKIIYDELWQEIHQCIKDTLETSDMEELLIPHKIFIKNSKRLELFRAILRKTPEILNKLVNDSSNYPISTSEIPGQMLLDVKAAWLTLRASESDSLATTEERNDWLTRIDNLFTTVDKLFDCWDTQNIDAKSFIQECRYQYSKISFVRLFIKHFDKDENLQENFIEHILPLWKLFEMCDFKQPESMNLLEKYLKTLTLRKIQKYKRSNYKCDECKQEFRKSYVCNLGHHICDACCKVPNDTFLECHRQLTPEVKLTSVPDINQIPSIKEFQRQKHKFFIDIVRSLCFQENSAPSDEVCDILIQYIMNRRTLSDEKLVVSPMDQTSSFLLLTLLLQHNRAYLVEKNLKPNHENSARLTVLLIHAFEASFRKGNASTLLTVHNLDKTLGVLQDVSYNTILKAKAVAQFKYMMLRLADVIHDSPRAGRLVTEEVKYIGACSTILNRDEYQLARVYLWSCLYFKYGLSIFQHISETKELKWILPEEYQFNSTIDHFALYEKPYQRAMSNMKNVVSNSEVGVAEAMSKLEKMGRSLTPEILIMVVYQLMYQRLKTEPMIELEESLKCRLLHILGNIFNEKKEDEKNCYVHWFKCITTDTCQSPINIFTCKTDRDYRLSELSLHVLTLLWSKKNPQLLFFRNFLHCAQENEGCFFPTMADDENYDILAAVGGDYSYYACPKGHIYAIGECGRPMERAKCDTCKAQIGGVMHKSESGNKKVDIKDKTALGHDLKDAGVIGLNKTGVRDISAITVSVIRLLSHISMMLGLNIQANGEIIASMIHHKPGDGHLFAFLWDHAHNDIKSLEKLLDKCHDDVIIWLHRLIKETKQIKGKLFKGVDLREKPGRKVWERKFEAHFVSPFTREAERYIKEDQKLLQADPILDKIKEPCPPISSVKDLTKLELEPIVWRYVTHISVKDVLVKLSGLCKDGYMEKMRIFLENIGRLKYVKYLMSVQKLQTCLLSRYNRNITREAAQRLKIGDAVRLIDKSNEKVAGWIRDFIEAWDYVREKVHLNPAEYGSTENETSVRLGPISMTDSVRRLLPTRSGPGLCAYAVVKCLSQIQTDFVQQCALPGQDTALVEFAHLMKTDVITVDEDKDIIPLIAAYANGDSLLMETESADQLLSHDFEGMAKGFWETFLDGKCRIEHEKMPLMTYREDITSKKVFEELQNKIPQEDLPMDIQLQILAEQTHLPDIDDHLRSLDVAISILASAGNTSMRNENLFGFMENNIKMKKSHISKQAKKCNLCHIQNFWVILSCERTKKQIEYNQECVFDDFSSIFKSEIPEAKKKRIGQLFCHMGDKLHIFMIYLYRAILFHFEDDYCQYGLGVSVKEFIASLTDNVHIKCLDDPSLNGDEMLVSNAISVWLLAVQFNSSQNFN